MEKPVTLCIIDDVPSVVKGLSTHIPWEEHGAQVVGTADNGEDGLNMIFRLMPQIILTDIRMPQMDGLELTRRVMEANPGCKVILISGYADFEYARQALRLGAFDFIKKPFSMEEVVQAVRKAVAEIGSEQEHERSLHQMERKVKESVPLLRQEYFSLLLHHRTGVESASRQWASLNVDLEPSRLIVMVLEIDGLEGRSDGIPAKDAEIMRFSLQNIVEETIGSHAKGVLIREALSRYALVMNACPNRTSLENAEQCRANVEAYTKFTVSIGVSEEAGRVEELPEAYRQALEAVQYAFYTGGNGVFGYADIREPLPEHELFTSGDGEEFEFVLRTGNKDKVLEWLEGMKEGIRNVRPLPRPDDAREGYHRLLAVFSRVMQDRLPEEAGIWEERVDSVRRKPHVTLQELQSMAEELCAGGCSSLEQSRMSETQEAIQKALHFIGGNLHRNLTIQMCADHVHISSSYFVSLFKKVTGMTLIQYVTQERMKRAKSMLLEGMQIQEIAQTLGYEERRYFSDVFKKQTGMTPSEFREVHLGGGKESAEV